MIIADRTGLEGRACDLLLTSLLEIIAKSLKNHVEVDLSGLGVFSIRVKESVEDDFGLHSSVDTRWWVPVFIPSKELKGRIDRENSGLAFTEVKRGKLKEQLVPFEASLRNQSKLGALGYNLRLSRDERWTILKDKAIPRYGRHQVRNHISWLVRLKRNDRHQDYSDAIFEWEHDLKRLDLL